MGDWHVYAIVAAAIVLDFMSGTIQAIANQSLSSRKLREGIYHKMGYIITIALAILLEYASSYMELGFNAPLAVPVCVYIVITEAVSIFENVAKINPALRESPIFKLLGQSQNRRKDDEK